MCHFLYEVAVAAFPQERENFQETKRNFFLIILFLCEGCVETLLQKRGGYEETMPSCFYKLFPSSEATERQSSATRSVSLRVGFLILEFPCKSKHKNVSVLSLIIVEKFI